MDCVANVMYSGWSFEPGQCTAAMRVRPPETQCPSVRPQSPNPPPDTLYNIQYKYCTLYNIQGTRSVAHFVLFSAAQ